MSEETTTTETSAPAGGAKQRPAFLTVVCILSFIGAGFGILAYIGAFTAMSMLEAGVSAMEGMAEDMGGTVTEGPGTGVIWAYIVVGFLTTIVSLVGVIQMWKLKKKGFMLYTGASVVSIIMTFVYAGFSVTAVVFPIAFIAMYYVNLKHME